jgi:penicillin-binding protein 1A
VKSLYLQRTIRFAGVGFTLLIGGLWLAVSGAYQYLESDLPDVAALADVRLQVPLRILSRDGRLIAPPIGEQRRIPLQISEIPQQMIDAVLAAEDDRFFSHNGVDYAGFARSLLHHLTSGDRSQGGGTITMQLTRSVFLTPEKTYRRKLAEIFLTLRIEQQFSKQEILSLYLNKMFLGQRAYGVGAAAEVYFGKTIDKLTIPEMAIIAGTFRTPSRENPVTNPKLAQQRRAYVLRRMHEKKFINDDEYQAALIAPVESKLHDPAVDVDGAYVAEMVRREMLERYGNNAYTEGYQVITTIDSRLQKSAVRAVRLGLIEYDRRHGYRGPTGKAKVDASFTDEQIAQLLADYSSPAEMEPAIVVAVRADHVAAVTHSRNRISIPFANMSWAKPALADGNVGSVPSKPSDVVSVGAVILVSQDTSGNWHLMQEPQAQAAFVGVDPQDGAISALVGGYDYYSSNFNRAVQAKRQPGSSFKPLLYSSALEHGFTAASVVNDSPIVSYDASSEGEWRPENYEKGSFLGPLRLREALVKSRNLVSIRVMQTLGPAYVADYVQRFGLTPEELPHNESLALGATQVAPLSMARAYAVFANGGFRIEPYLIERIEDGSGKEIFSAQPKVVCRECGADGESAMSNESSTPSRAPLAVSPQNAYVMTDMMSDVVRRGTAVRAALALKRKDLAGKTGTSNDGRDTWFCGFNADLVAVSWVGFDQERSLGSGEEGSRTALPIWIHFMGEALRGQPEHRLVRPLGLVDMRVSAATGLPAHAGDENTVMETFIEGQVPERNDGETSNPSRPTESRQDKTDDSIF